MCGVASGMCLLLLRIKAVLAACALHSPTATDRQKHRSVCRVARVSEQKLIASCASACAALGNFDGASRLAVTEDSSARIVAYQTQRSSCCMISQQHSSGEVQA